MALCSNSMFFSRSIKMILLIVNLSSLIEAFRPSQHRRPLCARYGRLRPRFSPMAATAANSDPIKAHRKELVIGLNKYSHDTSICVVDAATGEILFATEKERLSRRKHDAGPVDDLVAHALECLDADIDDIVLCVQNNHHHRIAPFEKRLPFGVDVNHYPASYLSSFNRLPCPTLELSHHLAHAWSALGTSPWAPKVSGQHGNASYEKYDAAPATLVVVMDGMGELFGEMENDLSIRTSLKADYESVVKVPYMHDLIPSPTASRPYLVPEAPRPLREWREAESAFVFGEGASTLAEGAAASPNVAPSEAWESSPVGKAISGQVSAVLPLRPVWKRFTECRSPSALENHGFHDMESMGAVYSRVSSVIFGDWNACGKVMGLAPWGALPVKNSSIFSRESKYYTGFYCDDWIAESTCASPTYRTKSVRKMKAEAAAAGMKNRTDDFINDFTEWGDRYRPYLLGPFGLKGHSPTADVIEVHWQGIAEQEKILRMLPKGAWKRVEAFEAITIAKQMKTTDKKDETALQDEYDDEDEAEGIAWLKRELEEAALAVQEDLEATAMPLIAALKTATGAKRLCLAGGVAQNSVLNGRLTRQLGFDPGSVFIPPCCGDEGIAVGCAIFGAHYLAEERRRKAKLAFENEQRIAAEEGRAPDVKTPPDAPAEAPEASHHSEVLEPQSKEEKFKQLFDVMSPYTGRHYSRDEIDEAIEEYENWIVVRDYASDDFRSHREDSGEGEDDVSDADLEKLVRFELGQKDSRGDPRLAKSAGFPAAVVAAARALTRGEPVAWFQGRSEFGPRALGARSLLADPRNGTLAKLLNRDVKCRESFRPFAPAVLAEWTHEWFEETRAYSSPYMQQTADTLEDRISSIPGVVHGADGTARLQTVARGKTALSEYRAIIFAFFALTGIPLILNTSLNIFKGEPIVESPADAIRAFIAGGRGKELQIGRLLMHDVTIMHRPCPLGSNNDEDKIAELEKAVPAWNVLVPRQRVDFRSEIVAAADGGVSSVRVYAAGIEADEARWITLTDSLELALLESAVDGTSTVGDLIAQFEVSAEAIEASDDDGEQVTARDIRNRLRHLWELTLLELHVSSSS